MKDSLPQKVYDELADSYAELVDKKPHNAYYDRPAVKGLVPSVVGKDIIEAGCGTGVYTEWLVEQGANVLGIDANSNMLRHAIVRNKDRAKFIQANLEEPLSFLYDESYDGILSALTITYLNDLGAVFSEFSRVLKKNGWLVFSTEHPFFSYLHNNLDSYYNTVEVHNEWKGFKKRVIMTSYYHSLGTITEALYQNGFLIERITEPLPLDEFREWDQKNYEEIEKFPLFIFIKAIKR